MNYVLKHIDKINTVAVNQQSSLAWKIVNNISGRKSTAQSKIKGQNQEVRLDMWKQHFSAPNITD